MTVCSITFEDREKFLQAFLQMYSVPERGTSRSFLSTTDHTTNRVRLEKIMIICILPGWNSIGGCLEQGSLCSWQMQAVLDLEPNLMF